MTKPGSQSICPVALLSVSGDGNQNRSGVFRLCSQPPRHFVAIDLRQTNVYQANLRLITPSLFQRAKRSMLGGAGISAGCRRDACLPR